MTDNVQVTATTSAYDGTALATNPGVFIRTNANTGTGQNVIFVAGTEEVIAAGETRTYELRGTIINAPITGDTVLVKVPDLSTTATTSDYGLASRNATIFTSEDKSVNDALDVFSTTTLAFIWTDRSVASHTLHTADWTNDYKVSGLPTTVLSLAK